MPAPLGYRLREFFARIGERLAALGHAITYPFERIVGWFGERLVHSGGGFSRVDSGLATFLRALTWPVRVVMRGFAACGRVLFPEPVRDAWFRFVAALGRGAGRLVDALNLDGAVRWLAWLTQPAWRPVAAILGFAYAWAVTRHYRQMLWGLPALLLVAPILAAGGWWLWKGPSSVAASYQVAVKQAREDEDYTTMRLWERKLAQLKVDTNGPAFETALALVRDPDEAKQADGRQRMQSLAPVDSPGYPPAHFWLVEQYLGGAMGDGPEERLRLVDAHLEQLRKAGIRGESVDFARALWLLQSGKREEGAEALQKLAPKNPMAASQLMLVSVELGRPEDARREAARVRTYLLDEQNRGAQPTPQSMQLLAVAEQLLGNVSGCEAALRQWIAVDPERPEPRAALGEISLNELRVAILSQRPDGARLAQLLSDAVRFMPPQTPLGDAVAAIALRDDGPRLLRAMAESLNDVEDAPASLMLLVGTHLAQIGEAASAERLFERSVASDPGNGAAWNNYAWVLMNLEGSDRLTTARAAADRAVAIDPDSPSFRETRGQVLAKLAEWEAAAADLEYALNGLPDSKPTHAALARAYREFGKPELAAAHEELAK
ncbi:MAG: hypothetical protein KF847_05860 [Pirellulales bacterium]|nr:hypothetical protein [Pirellulales bacterium]